MSVRAKVAVELSILAVLTTLFIILFPRRHPAIDVGLAAFALLCIALSAGYTKNVIWAASPAPVTKHRLKRCVTLILWIK